MPQPIGVICTCDSTEDNVMPLLASPGARAFKVLLRDNRTFTVPGHALQYLPGSSQPSDVATYGIIGSIGQKQVLVAVFGALEVVGIFDGELMPAQSAQDGTELHGGVNERC